MAKKEEQIGPGPRMGPRKNESKVNDSWSRDTGSDVIPDPPDSEDDRLVQMRHGDESAEVERTTEEPASADFFEPLDADRGADARRREGE
jgi:hypothetical protein